MHVRFARDEQGARPSSLYVDPYDARVLGAPRGEEFFATVRRLHRWLLIPGDAKGWERQITGVAANSASMPSPAKFVFAECYADKTFGEKIIANLLDIHRGAFLGWPGKLAFMLAAALMPQFAVTGVLLYLSRRRLRRRDDPPSSCHFACMRRSSMTTSVLMA